MYCIKRNLTNKRENGIDFVCATNFCLDKSFIKSVDTSNPIAYAIEFGLYNDEIKKPKLKIDDIMDIKLDQNTILDIEDNILIFKSMIHKFKNYGLW